MKCETLSEMLGETRDGAKKYFQESASCTKGKRSFEPNETQTPFFCGCRTKRNVKSAVQEVRKVRELRSQPSVPELQKRNRKGRNLKWSLRSWKDFAAGFRITRP